MISFYLYKGMLSAWDTRQNKCFIHWEGDSTEIGKDLTDTLMLHPVSNRNGVSYPLSFLWRDVRGGYVVHGFVLIENKKWVI